MTKFLKNIKTDVQGPEGYQGYSGNNGPQGYDGVQGAIGTQGFPGEQGLTGFQGFQGDVGTQGAIGAQGYQGSIGLQGHMGSQGSQGLNGAQGAQGNQGNAGNIGSQGSVNMSGSSADAGVPLQAGWNGSGDGSYYNATYVSLGSNTPSVTITTGTSAIIIISSDFLCGSSGEQGYISFSVTNKNNVVTTAADDSISATGNIGANTGNSISIQNAIYITNLTPGSNTFTMKYKVTSSSTCWFYNRKIIVIPQ